MSIDELKSEAIRLLEDLIRTPSVSKSENKSADLIVDFLAERGVEVGRIGNNVFAFGGSADPGAPTVMLCSHHDTVPPSASYTRDPYDPHFEDGKLYGLGSNDAGGCLVAYLSAFLFVQDKIDYPYRLVMLAAAEEEISGKGGISAVLPVLPKVDFCFVGEPTGMAAAVAEKGLVVLDCVAQGRSGHAARSEGINAIEIAMQDIKWLHEYAFANCSETLGPIKMTVTCIKAGTAHNVVPDRCDFVVDVRTTDAYTNEQTVELIASHLKSAVEPRSIRLQPSGLEATHPFFELARHHGIATYGSPTLSDQALLTIPSVKIGPGQSSRSHQADEYVLVNEVEDGIEVMVQILESLKLPKTIGEVLI